MAVLLQDLNGMSIFHDHKMKRPLRESKNEFENPVSKLNTKQYSFVPFSFITAPDFTGYP